MFGLVACFYVGSPTYDTPTITRSSSSNEPFIFGDTITYSCSDPTQGITGVSETTCQIDGSWSPTNIGTCTTIRKWDHEA